MAVEQLTHRQLRDLSLGKDFAFRTTRQLQPLREIIGQDRAIKALEFGLEIRSQGYNIFVAGYPGTGRQHVITRFLAERTPTEPPAPDWCYVHNFTKPDEPVALRLPAGRGPLFAGDLEKTIEQLRRQLPKTFESEQYNRRRNELLSTFVAQREKIQEKLNKSLRQQGLAMQQTPLGVGIVPLNPAGEPMKREEFDSLPPEKQEAIRNQQESVQSRLELTMRQLRQLETRQQEKIREIDEAVARKLVEEVLKDLCEKYAGDEKICRYLQALTDDIVKNHAAFLGGGNDEQEAPQPIPALAAAKGEARFDRYKVNVFVTNDATDGSPVIAEANPTHPNLFGRIERRYTLGALVTDFTMLKAGAVHKANGGYLVIDAIDVLMRPGAWEALKRTIESRQVAVEDLGQALGYAYTETLRPEPIPMEAKIILIGNPMIYQLLFSLDEDFRNLFKVKAE
ncbi:MAG: AAA family ATPase, partial [Anaerolineaceae bacterium]|nr:AAA family ATPase [Anaerolineaceae bacterium]